MPEGAYLIFRGWRQGMKSYRKKHIGKYIKAGKYGVLSVICMLSALLTACAGTEEEDTETSKGYTLTAFIQQSVSDETGIWNNWAAEKLKEDTGIMLDFYPTGDNVEKKILQYIVAGEIPDIIGFKGTDQVQYALDAGLLLPLEKYKDELPNLFENEIYADAIEYTKSNVGDESGLLYVMPTSIGENGMNAYNWIPLLQWSAYKEIGTPPLSTLEDYLDVVEEMMKVKPLNENGEKIYGFSLFSDWDKNTALEVATLSFYYGIDTEYVSDLMETNVITREISSVLDEDSFYKRALHFYFEANQRGLLDPESVTQTYKNASEKYSEGRVMFSYFSWLTGSYNLASSGHVNNENDVDGYATIVADDMKLYEAPNQTVGRNWYFAISSSCKDVDKACELLNWLYDEDTISYLYNGPQGIIWDYDESGEPYVLEDGWKYVDNSETAELPVDGGGTLLDGSYAFNALGIQAQTFVNSAYSISYRYWPTTLDRSPTLMQQEVLDFLGTNTLGDYLRQHDMIAKSTQAVNMLPVIPDRMQSIITKIGEYVQAYSWDIIYAKDEEEFNLLWEEMRTLAYNNNMDVVEAYYENAWKKALNTAQQYEGE